MTAHVMAHDFLDVIAGGGGQSASGSRMRKLMGSLAGRRQNLKLRHQPSPARQGSADACYDEQITDEADELVLQAEEHEGPSAEAATSDWSDESPVDAAVDSEHEDNDDVPPSGDDGDKEPDSDAKQNRGDTEEITWHELTPLDIERARAVLAARRNEILARHVAELEALDQEEAQVAGLAHTIAVFMRRYATRTESAEQGASD